MRWKSRNGVGSIGVGRVEKKVSGSHGIDHQPRCCITVRSNFHRTSRFLALGRGLGERPENEDI